MPIEQTGPRTYSAPTEEIAPHVVFLRWNEMLLHLCTRSNVDLGVPYPDTVFFTAMPVSWNPTEGVYYCIGCKKTYQTAEELYDVWEDGEGTGHEGHA